MIDRIPATSRPALFDMGWRRSRWLVSGPVLALVLAGGGIGYFLFTQEGGVGLDETFTLHLREEVKVRGTGLTIRLETMVHAIPEVSGRPVPDTVFFTATSNGAPQDLAIDVGDNATANGYAVHVPVAHPFSDGSPVDLLVLPR